MDRWILDIGIFKKIHKKCQLLLELAEQQIFYLPAATDEGTTLLLNCIMNYDKYFKLNTCKLFIEIFKYVAPPHNFT